MGTQMPFSILPFSNSLSLSVFLFRHSSFHRLINIIQQDTNTENRVCGGVQGGSPGSHNKDIEKKTETGDTQTETHTHTQARTHNKFYIHQPSSDVSLLFKTQPT